MLPVDGGRGGFHSRALPKDSMSARMPLEQCRAVPAPTKVHDTAAQAAADCGRLTSPLCSMQFSSHRLKAALVAHAAAVLAYEGLASPWKGTYCCCAAPSHWPACSRAATSSCCPVLTDARLLLSSCVLEGLRNGSSNCMQAHHQQCQHTLHNSHMRVGNNPGQHVLISCSDIAQCGTALCPDTGHQGAWRLALPTQPHMLCCRDSCGQFMFRACSHCWSLSVQHQSRGTWRAYHGAAPRGGWSVLYLLQCCLHVLQQPVLFLQGFENIIVLHLLTGVL